MNELPGIRFGSEITAAARAYGLDPKLLAAVAAQETGGPGSSSGNNVTGDAGHGRGLFQIDDRSWAFARSAAASDPAANAAAAASILADNLQRYGGSVRAALSAYNSGSPTAAGTSTTWQDGRRLGYADSVMRHFSDLGGTRGELAAEAPGTSASVNALGAYNATLPSGGYSYTAQGNAPQIDSALASLQNADAPSSQSQFSPVRTWAGMTSGQSGSSGAAAGSAADAAIADILDQGNVFGSGGDDD